MTVTTEQAVPAAPQVAGVRATARMTAAIRGGTTTLPVLDGDGPFEFRRLRSRGTEARVCIVGAMSAPLGGDRLRIEATAEQGAALHVTSAAATLALRGPTPAHATYDVHLTVAEQAELRWLPKPLIDPRPHHPLRAPAGSRAVRPGRRPGASRVRAGRRLRSRRRARRRAGGRRCRRSGPR